MIAGRTDVFRLCDRVEDLVAELRHALGAMQAESRPTAPISQPKAQGAVLGARAAAELLAVGRHHVGRVINELPVGDPRRPAMVPSRGGKLAPWWESADSCRGWWRRLHSTQPRPPRRRCTTRSNPAPLRRTTRERLDEI